MSSAGRCIARKTSSGMVVGPGSARNSRPARTTMLCFLSKGFAASGAHFAKFETLLREMLRTSESRHQECREMAGNSSEDGMISEEGCHACPIAGAHLDAR